MDKEYNLLLFNMSTANINPKWKSISELENNTTAYFDKEDKVEPFEAIMTNEGSYIYLYKKLKADNKKIDKIMYIASGEVRKPLSDNFDCRETHEEFYLRRLKEFWKKEGLSQIPDIDGTISIPDDPNGSDLLEISSLIVKKLIDFREQLNKDTEFNIYIDSNGGIRDFIVVLTTIIQTLPENINIKLILGHNYNRKDRYSMVLDKTSTYRIYDFYSGINEFIDYGRCEKLYNYYTVIMNQEQQDEFKDIMNTIISLSDGYSLCRPEDILKYTKELNEKTEHYVYSNSWSIKDYFIWLIRKEYKQVFEALNIDSHYDYTALKEMILFCLNHNLIQQALTFYAECMPKIIYDRHIVYRTKDQDKLGIDTHWDNYSKYNKKNIKRYDEEYVFIQQYIFVENGGLKEHYMSWREAQGRLNNNISSLDDINDYSSIVKSMLEDGFLATDFTNYNLIGKIIKEYRDIKEVRNGSNHASTDVAKRNFKTTKKAIETIKRYLEHIDTLIEGR